MIGRKRSISAYSFKSQFITEGIQNRNSNTAGTGRLMQRPERTDIFSLLSYTIQDHPSRGGITHSELIPHTSIEKIYHRVAYKPI